MGAFYSKVGVWRVLAYSRRMIWKSIALAMLWAVTLSAEDAPVPDIGQFYEWTEGQYQVYAQGGRNTGMQVNHFMNEMLKQYSKYFSNWQPKAGARVIVFTNMEEFRAYTATTTKLSHQNLLGYCHLKTDEAGNQFYELVTYQHDKMWSTLAHEGFHQFLGYELGLQVPLWLNEGMAQYFETSYVLHDRLHAGNISKSKLAAAQTLIETRKAPALADLLQWDRATFYENAQVAYPTSWALVYFLLEGEGQNYYNSTFRKFLQDLKSGQDDLASFQKRFGRDTKQLQAEFDRYIMQLRANFE